MDRLTQEMIGMKTNLYESFVKGVEPKKDEKTFALDSHIINRPFSVAL
jgi:hypothetical protein